MAWIKTVPLSEADERLRRLLKAQHDLYPPEYGPVAGADDLSRKDMPGIVGAHTLIPDALYHAFSTFGALMAPDLPLTRRRHEMIATTVSVLNRCQYCSTSHAEFLRHVTLDEELVAALRRNYTTAPMSETDRVMLDYVAKITEDATKIGPDDHERLRAAGFDDTAILQITLIASWFNYINRVADALGVGRE